MKVLIDNKEIKEENLEDMIIRLRKDWSMTCREISDVLDTSRTTVSTYLMKKGISGKQKYNKELYNYKTYEAYTIEKLAKKHNLLISRIEKLRRQALNKHQRNEPGMRIESRRNLLIHNMYGEGYVAGENFVKVFTEAVKDLYPRQQELLLGFYIRGLADSELGNPKSVRTYRSHALKKLLKNLSFIFTKIEAIEKGFISYA